MTPDVSNPAIAPYRGRHSEGGVLSALRLCVGFDLTRRAEWGRPPGGGMIQGRLGLRLSESVCILLEVTQCAINHPSELFFQIFGVSIFAGEHHPAKLNGLANRLVNLGWTKEQSIIWVIRSYRSECHLMPSLRCFSITPHRFPVSATAWLVPHRGSISSTISLPFRVQSPGPPMFTPTPPILQTLRADPRTEYWILSPKGSSRFKTSRVAR